MADMWTKFDSHVIHRKCICVSFITMKRMRQECIILVFLQALDHKILKLSHSCEQLHIFLYFNNCFVFTYNFTGPMLSNVHFLIKVLIKLCISNIHVSVWFICVNYCICFQLMEYKPVLFFYLMALTSPCKEHH